LSFSKKKRYFRLNCFEPYLLDSIFLSLLCWPIILRFSYKHYLVLQTDKLDVGDKKTTSKNSHNKHGQFPTCRHPIMENISIWIQEESPGFPKRHFGLFHGNSAIKGRPFKPSGAYYHFSLKKQNLLQKKNPSVTLSSAINISCISILDF